MRPHHLLPIGVSILLAACGGDRPANEQAPTLVIGEGEGGTLTILHQMPTPNELFLQVREMAGDGDRRLLNPAAQADRYATLRSRAVNFGIYSTDLVYASSFKLNVEVARYYLATKKLAEALGLNAVFTDAEFVRLESNLTRGDSLEVISNEVYLRAYERLQTGNMAPVLAMVLVGGWTESMYLMMRHGVAGGDTDALRMRLAEQKSTLEHLIALTEAQSSDPEVSALRIRLQEILDIYDQVTIQRKPNAGRSSSGRQVLGDDVRMEITDDKYRVLQEAVERLRTDLARPEDKPNA